MSDILVVIGKVNRNQYKQIYSQLRRLRGVYPKVVRLDEEVVCPISLSDLFDGDQDAEERFIMMHPTGATRILGEIFESLTDETPQSVVGIMMTESSWLNPDNVFVNKQVPTHDIFDNLKQTSVLRSSEVIEIVYLSES